LAEQKCVKSYPDTSHLAASEKYYEHHAGQYRRGLYWACNLCIREQRAILANPSKQKWCDVPPYFAYFDEERNCADCSEPFLFSKEEQKHWYETLKFWVQSRPIRCKTCTKRRKQRESVLPVDPPECVVDSDQPTLSLDRAVASRAPARICEALHQIGALPPTDALRKAVEQQLSHKHNGVQTIAARVLTTWGGHEVLSVLYEWFLRNSTGHQLRSEAAQLIAEILRPTANDTQWAIERFLSLPGYSARFDFLAAVAAVSSSRATPMFRSAWKSADRDLKHAILVAMSEMRAAEANGFFRRALEDEDDYIRELSECFLGFRSSVEWVSKQVDKELRDE
jgi:hypothetical protein